MRERGYRRGKKAGGRGNKGSEGRSEAEGNGGEERRGENEGMNHKKRGRDEAEAKKVIAKRET